MEEKDGARDDFDKQNYRVGHSFPSTLDRLFYETLCSLDWGLTDCFHAATLFNGLETWLVGKWHGMAKEIKICHLG